MSLTREQILELNDIKTKEITISEWGGTVFIKELSRKQMEVFEKMMEGFQKNQDGAVVKMLLKTVCDENGKQLFTDTDINILSEKNNKAIMKIFNEIIFFNAISNEKFEAIEKN